jgi:hypothetical protein
MYLATLPIAALSGSPRRRSLPTHLPHLPRATMNGLDAAKSVRVLGWKQLDSLRCEEKLLLMPGQSQLHLRKHQRHRRASFFRQKHSLPPPFRGLQLLTGHHQLACLAPTGQTRSDVNNKVRQEKALHHGQLHNTSTRGVVPPRRLEVQKTIFPRELQHAILGPNRISLTLHLQHLSTLSQATLPGGVLDQLKVIRSRTTTRANLHLHKLSTCSSPHDQHPILVIRVKEPTLLKTVMRRFAIQAQTS